MKTRSVRTQTTTLTLTMTVSLMMMTDSLTVKATSVIKKIFFSDTPDTGNFDDLPDELRQWVVESGVTQNAA